MILRIVDLSNNYFLFFKYIYLTRITAIFTIIRKLLIRFMPIVHLLLSCWQWQGLLQNIGIG